MIEIERKFLVQKLPPLSGAVSAVVRQGYVTRPEDSVSLRLRQKGDTYFLTVKDGEGMVRAERETEISKAQFTLFWPLSEGRRLEKTRWTGLLPTGEVFELDLFQGPLAGLCLVEVEFDSPEAAAAFQPPEWFGRDVTEDPAFGNRALAAAGLPKGIMPQGR
ncbi:hypothetical protein TRM7557_00348 [Tritonibacter multivorans]|uniref:CYTH domain-containing protein n=1 Tax=Tritonibacter multivorans TaxID=928856 RepID=A0A0N7LYN5_9RHOB|nr:CYTH domain-containing protein [Tritonibacter multivorans]MDA7419386.1 CYTH domain-containing protein [Tritonibacter multivorans]CUH75361.1 hypothetical protein TRM7557_00348 [Tritonibacter multivorans]SFD20698.1 CYTH domain-containing protein [Tritonibacter multivorans]